MSKPKFLAWFNWKNPDEMKSRPLSETICELNLSVMMTYNEFAKLMQDMGRSEFTIEFKKFERM